MLQGQGSSNPVAAFELLQWIFLRVATTQARKQARGEEESCLLRIKALCERKYWQSLTACFYQETYLDIEVLVAVLLRRSTCKPCPPWSGHVGVQFFADDACKGRECIVKTPVKRVTEQPQGVTDYAAQERSNDDLVDSDTLLIKGT